MHLSGLFCRRNFKLKIMEEKIKIGVSSCLLGKEVRYNGGHSHDRYITEILGA